MRLCLPLGSIKEYLPISIKIALDSLNICCHFFGDFVMNVKKYIFLGIVLTIGIAGCVAGCVIEKKWFTLIALIPTIFALLCAYGIDRSKDTEGSFISEDGWYFMIALCIAFIIGVPVLLFHGGHTGSISMGCSLGGSAVVLIGYFIFANCFDREEAGFTQPF